MFGLQRLLFWLVMGVWFVGGYLSCIFLCYQYVRFTIRKRRRTPWSYFLGAALTMSAFGMTLVRWDSAWGNGLWLASFLVYLIGLVPYRIAVRRVNNPTRGR